MLSLTESCLLSDPSPAWSSHSTSGYQFKHHLWTFTCWSLIMQEELETWLLYLYQDKPLKSRHSTALHGQIPPPNVGPLVMLSKSREGSKAKLTNAQVHRQSMSQLLWSDSMNVQDEAPSARNSDRRFLHWQRSDWNILLPHHSRLSALRKTFDQDVS